MDKLLFTIYKFTLFKYVTTLGEIQPLLPIYTEAQAMRLL